MPDAVALWHAEHTNFAWLLALMDAQIALFHDGGDPDYELMVDVMFYLTHYADVRHHPKEDLAFARLKALDPKLAKTVDELARQHKALEHAGSTLIHMLDDILDGSMATRERVEAAAREYVDTLRKHMRTEETEILPSAAKLMSAQDWQAIHAAIAQIDDPLFGHNPEQRYVALHRQIARHARP
jgi:hemerythrin-like domain-containing protein